MTPDTSNPADLAARLAAHLPLNDLEALAAAAINGADQVQRLRATTPSAVVRGACDDVLRILRRRGSEPFVAGALLGAARAVQQERERQKLDVVWTGPESPVTTTRLTSTVVTHLIDSAHQDLLLVSFATQAEPSIEAALQRASARGVILTMLLENPSDNPRYTTHDTPFARIRARRLAWPAQNRPRGASIHAKIIVVDRQTALIGSANLTGHALEKNLECGILLSGGPQPARIADHIIGLYETSHFMVI